MCKNLQLEEAACYDRVDDLVRLLDEGADVEEKGKVWTPLHGAVENQNYECVKILLERGANPHIPFEGWKSALEHAVDTIVDSAAQNGKKCGEEPVELIELLLSYGVDVEPGIEMAKRYKCRKILTLLGYSPGENEQREEECKEKDGTHWLIRLIKSLFISSEVKQKGVTQEPDILDYDKVILLDAENLAEGGIGDAYRDDIIPVLKNYVDSPEDIVEEVDSEFLSYVVKSKGQAYVIFSPDIDDRVVNSWAKATYALFDIVNHQLQDSPVRFYAINGGNDLGGLFLEKVVYEEAIKTLKQDRPYLPTMEPPGYGMV